MTTMNPKLKRALQIFTAICVIFTIVVGSFIVTNFRNVMRMVYVGLLVKTQALQPVTTEQLLEGAVRGMVDSLDDPYSAFMDSEEFTEMQNYIHGTIGGIGIYVGVKDNNLVVQSPVEGSPAALAGIRADDIIIKIDDKSTAELKYDDAVNMMRGEPGTEVKIRIMREGVAELLDFILVRQVIDLPTVSSNILPGEPKIGHIRLSMFASNSDEALAMELENLENQGIKGLILDLRDNPGGDLETAVNIAKFFVPAGPIIYSVSRSGVTETYEVSGDSAFDLPLVVLINEGSASASEVLAGALKDTKSAILVGEKTFGKGIVQSVLPLPGGDGLKLTTSKYLTPNKIDIHEKGIEPDVVVVQEESVYEDFDDDLQLQKAITIIKEQL